LVSYPISLKRNSTTVRCIFCKNRSEDSKSREHIIPESLGNKDTVLPVGIVCDQCNNYFARKVEQPVLEAEMIKVKRFTQVILNKRGRVPSIDGIIDSKEVVKIDRDKDGKLTVSVPTDIYNQYANGKGEGRIILPTSGKKPDPSIFSRFLAKMALEALAQRFSENPDLLDQLVDDPQFDPIREHARTGSGHPWAFNERFLYDERATHRDGADEYIILHEYDFVFTSIESFPQDLKSPIYSELYFVFVLFGIEYAINVGGPNVDGYLKWLSGK
jgi:HNH endonuclease